MTKAHILGYLIGVAVGAFTTSLINRPSIDCPIVEEYKLEMCRAETIKAWECIGDIK